MKKITFFLTTIFIVSIANAQIKFQKVYYPTYFNIDSIFIEGYHDVRQTSDGGYIVLGEGFYWTGDFLDDFNGFLCLIKTDAYGNVLWSKVYDAGDSADYGASVQQTSDGGYIVAGGTNSFGAGSYDVYLIKTDANGDILWSKVYGGMSDDRAFSIQQTIDGGYIVAGETKSFGTGGYNVYLIKADANGNILWTKIFGDTLGGGGWAYSIKQTFDGGYIIAGDLYGRDCLIKTDAMGGIQWAKTYGYGTGRIVEQTTDGGFITTGMSLGDVILIKINGSGDIVWSKIFRKPNDKGLSKSVQQTADGGYILGINFEISEFEGTVLIKTDANGDTLWTKDYGACVALDCIEFCHQTTDGGYIFVGFAGNLQFHLAKTDVYGNIQCNSSYANIILADTSTVASFVTPIIIDSGGQVNNVATIVSNIAFSDTVWCIITGLPDEINSLNIEIYPNPTSGKLTIKFSFTDQLQTEITIYNLLGKLIYKIPQQKILKELFKVDFSDQPAGIYYVKVKTTEGILTRKVVIIR